MKPVSPSCSQAQNISSHLPSASMLVLGGLELTTTSDQVQLLKPVVDLLPSADCVVSTLVTPLQWSNSPIIAQTLRYNMVYCNFKGYVLISTQPHRSCIDVCVPVVQASKGPRSESCVIGH